MKRQAVQSDRLLSSRAVRACVVPGSEGKAANRSGGSSQSRAAEGNCTSCILERDGLSSAGRTVRETLVDIDNAPCGTPHGIGGSGWELRFAS